MPTNQRSHFCHATLLLQLSKCNAFAMQNLLANKRAEAIYLEAPKLNEQQWVRLIAFVG